MSAIPNFCFLQRDAHTKEHARAFMEQILATRRFWRNEKSQIMFEVAPGDYCLLERKQNLQSVLEDGAVLTVVGDLDASTFDTLWVWITAAKWKLPRLNPEIPDAPPLPLRNVGVVRR